MGGTRFEQTAPARIENPDFRKRGTKSGTLKGDSSDSDPDLALIMDSWHDLPDRMKAEIVRAVQPYTRTPDASGRRAAVRTVLRQAHNDDRQADRTYEGGGEQDRPQVASRRTRPPW